MLPTTRRLEFGSAVSTSLSSNFGDRDRHPDITHSSVRVVSPQNAKRWKASTVRLFGLLTLTLGCCLAALILIVLVGSPLQMLYPGLHLLVTMMALLFTVNLIYIGWHTVARGSIPIRPRAPVTWQDVSNLKNVTSSLSTVSTVAWTVVLFVGCTALGAGITVSYTRWANYLLFVASRRDAPVLLSAVAFGRQMAFIQIAKWLMLIAHFPVSMSVSIIGGMLCGLIRKRPAGNIAGAVGVLFAGPILSLMLWNLLVLALWTVFRSIFFFYYYLRYLALLPAAAVILSWSRIALIGSSDSNLRPRPKHWSSHFLRTISIVGLPSGLALGLILGSFPHDMYWTLPGLETVCAALYGASLVYTDRDVSKAP